MARGRFVSKAISLDEKVDALSDDTARLLFTWLITHLDCEGRMHGDAQTVKSIVFPRRKITPEKVEKYLKELSSAGLIMRYFVGENEYLCMPNFEKHQPGLQKSKEAQSQIPPFTPELLQSCSRVTPPQVKDEVKDETKTEDKENTPLTPLPPKSKVKETKVKETTVVVGNLSKEDVLEAYRQNIGELSGGMDKQVELAVDLFSAPWVADAIREALLHNKRTWVYIAGILKNWKKDGKEGDLLPSNKDNPRKSITDSYEAWKQPKET